MDWTVARSALILKTLYTRRRCGCWPSACAKALMAYSGSSFDAGRRALNVTVQKRSSSDNSTSSSKISERPLSSIRARKYVIATATASFTSVMIQVCHILLGGCAPFNPGLSTCDCGNLYGPMPEDFPLHAKTESSSWRTLRPGENLSFFSAPAASRGSTTYNGIMKPETDRGHTDIARVHIPRERKEPMARRRRAL